MAILSSKQDSVYYSLRDRIAGGEYTAGSAIPTEYRLIETYGVSRTIVRISLSRLEREGLIIRRTGAGSFVSERARELLLAEKGAVQTRIGFVFPPGQRGNPVHIGIIQEFAALRIQGVEARVVFDDTPHFERYLRLGLDFCALDGALLDTFRVIPQGWAGRIVALNRASERFNHICTDNHEGGQMLARHLLQLGHRRIGLIHFGSDTEQDFTHRLRGIYAGLRGADIEPALELAIKLHDYRAFTPHAAAEHMLLAVQEGRVSGIIVMTDLLALPVYEVAEQMGLRTGEDFSIIGFDDQPFSRFLLPALTTARQPLTEIAAKLGKIVSEYSKGSRPFCACKIPPVLIERESVRRV